MIFSFQKSLRLLTPLLVLTLVGQGCLGGSKPVVVDGGVFRTTDAAVQWTHLKTFNMGAKLASAANVGTVSAAFDPQDPSALYVGTTENGLMHSLDGGDSWMPAKGLSVGRINAVAVDAKNKCVVYAARANQIFKTSNCLRDWNQVFFDPRTDKTFTALALDWFNNNIMFAGTSDGDVFRSDDAGRSWRVSHRVTGVRINNIAIDPRDSRIVYAATDGAGILKTIDSGSTWKQITKELEEFDAARRPTAVVLDPNSANTIYNISKYGILRSNDGGATWLAVKLPTPPGAIDIKALSIHPKNSRSLVYVTDTSIVFTDDGGVTWTPKKLPTARGVSWVLYSTATNNPLYLGAMPIPQSNSLF